MKIDQLLEGKKEILEERQNLWPSLKKKLSVDLDPETISCIESVYLTGRRKENCTLSDYAVFRWFPVQTPSGWDYLFENAVKGSAIFEELFYDSIKDKHDVIEDYENEIAFWDYFHPNKFESEIKSRVVVGAAKKKVSLLVKPNKLYVEIAKELLTYLMGRSSVSRHYPKWVLKKDYFYSVIPSVDNVCFDVSNLTVEYKVIRDKDKEIKFLCGRLTRRLMEEAVNYSPSEKIKDPNLSRENFLKDYAKQLDMLEEMPVGMKSLWEKIKNGEDLNARPKNNIFSFWKR